MSVARRISRFLGASLHKIFKLKHSYLFFCKLLNFFFLAFQKSRKDVSNFDREFTSEAPKLTPTDKLFIMNLDQCEFSGFSYVNPEFVVTV